MAFLMIGCGATSTAPAPASAPAGPPPASEKACAFVKSGCWREFVVGANACLGASADAGAVVKGVLSEDAKTCTYSEGLKIQFARPVLIRTKGAPQEAVGDHDFTVTSHGKTCLHYVQTQNEITEIELPSDTEYSTHRSQFLNRLWQLPHIAIELFQLKIASSASTT